MTERIYKPKPTCKSGHPLTPGKPCQVCRATRVRAWKATHPDQWRAIQRRSYRTHRAAKIAAVCVYQREHAEERKAYQATYYRKHKAALAQRTTEAAA